MFTISIKNYRDSNGEIVTSWDRLLTIPFDDENTERSLGYDAGIINPTVKVECGKAATLEFSMESNSPYFNAFLIMKTLLLVEYDGDVIFHGRVLSLDDAMFGTRSIHCEGDLAFLLDVQYPGKVDSDRTSQNMGTFITQVMGYYNDNIHDADKRIAIGHIPGSYPRQDEDFHYNSEQEIGEETKKHGSSSWSSVGDVLNSLKSNYGGWWRTRYDKSSNTAYLDWLNWYFNPKVNEQTLSITENMINVSSTVELSDIFTVLIPVGTKNTTRTNKNSKDTALYIEGYNTNIHGSNKYIKVSDLVKVYSENQLNKGYHTYSDYLHAIDDYGWIFKTVSFGNADTQAKLWQYAVDWIKENYIGKNRQFTITAIDLHSIGYDCEKIMVGDRITVELPYDSDTERRLYTVLSISYDLYNPENNSYTIGVPTDNKASREYGTKNNKSTTKKKSSTASTDPKKDPAKEEFENAYHDLGVGLADFLSSVGLITDEGAAYLIQHLDDNDDERLAPFQLGVSLLSLPDAIYRSTQHLLWNNDTGVIQGLKSFWGTNNKEDNPQILNPDLDWSLLGNFTNSMTNVQYNARNSRFEGVPGTSLTDDDSDKTYSFGVGIDGTTGYIYARKLILIDNDEPFELTNKLIVLGGTVNDLDTNLQSLYTFASDLDKKITVVASDVFQVGATMSDNYLQLNKDLLLLDKTVTNLSSDVTNIGQTMDTSLANMTVELARLGKTVTNITSDVVNIGQQISTDGAYYTQELAKLGLTVTNLTADVVQVGNGLTKAQADAAAAGDSVLAINKDIAIINSALTIIGGDIPSDMTKAQFIKQVNDNLTATYSDLVDYFGEDSIMLPELAKVTYVNNLVSNFVTTDQLLADTAFINSLFSKSILTNKIDARIGTFNFIEAESISGGVALLDVGVATRGTVNAGNLRGGDIYLTDGIENNSTWSIKGFIKDVQIVPVGTSGTYKLQYRRYSDNTTWVDANPGTFSVAASVTLTGTWDSAGQNGKASYVEKDQNGTQRDSTYIQGTWENGSYKVKDPDNKVLLFTNLTSVVPTASANSDSNKNVTASVNVYYTSPYDTSGTARDTGKTGLTVTVNAGTVYNNGWAAAYDKVAFPTTKNTTTTFDVSAPASVVGSEQTKTYTLKDILISTSSTSGNVGLYQGTMQVAQLPIKTTVKTWNYESAAKGVYTVYVNANSDSSKWVAIRTISGSGPYNTGWAAAVAALKINGGGISSPTANTSSAKVTITVPSSTVDSTTDLSFTMTLRRDYSTTLTESKNGYIDLVYKSVNIARTTVSLSGSSWITDESAYPKGVYRVYAYKSGTTCVSIYQLTGAIPYNNGYNSGWIAGMKTLTWPSSGESVQATIKYKESNGASNTTKTLQLVDQLKNSEGGSYVNLELDGIVIAKRWVGLNYGPNSSGVLYTDSNGVHRIKVYVNYNSTENKWLAMAAFNVQSAYDKGYSEGKAAGSSSSTTHSISNRAMQNVPISSGLTGLAYALGTSQSNLNSLGSCSSGKYYGVRITCGSANKYYYWTT